MITRSIAPRLPRPSTTCINLFKSSAPAATRHHSSYPPRQVPAPTPFVPDVPTFLRLIGRQLTQHASKFNTWDQLFSASSRQLRDLGVEPPRARRYLIMWRERFRRGEYGIGGDMTHVQDGVGEVRVVDREGKRPLAINTPMLQTEEPKDGGAAVVPPPLPVVDADEGKIVKGVKVKEPGIVVGEYFRPVKGTFGRVARIKIEDGMWEIKRGKKILGGERRRKYNLSVLRRKAKEAAK